MRGIFFDEDEARAAVAALVADGYAAEAGRERLAGEDDDEDHPWAVVTDAPQITLELLVERYDGWLDLELPEPTRVALPPSQPPGQATGPAAGGAAMELPDGPRRIKRPGGTPPDRRR